MSCSRYAQHMTVTLSWIKISHCKHPHTLPIPSYTANQSLLSSFPLPAISFPKYSLFTYSQNFITKLSTLLFPFNINHFSVSLYYIKQTHPSCYPLVQRFLSQNLLCYSLLPRTTHASLSLSESLLLFIFPAHSCLFLIPHFLNAFSFSSLTEVARLFSICLYFTLSLPIFFRPSFPPIVSYLSSFPFSLNSLSRKTVLILPFHPHLL